MDDFKNTVNSIKTNGLKNALFNRSTIDVSAVNAYNQAITNGISAQDALAQASKTTNKETINLIKSANGAKVSSEALAAAQGTTTVATKAASLAMKAFSVAANVLIITLIMSAISSLISKIQEAKEEISNTAEKAGESLDTAKSDLQELNSLIKEYNDLHTSGRWDNTDIETKKQLQKDVNSLLGDEADKVDIIEGKYKNITAELYRQRLVKLGETEKAASDALEAEKGALRSENKNDKLKFKYGEIKAKDNNATYYDDLDTLKYYIEEYDDIIQASKKTSLGANSKTSAFITTKDFKNVEDLITLYDRLKQMAQEMYDNGDTGAFYDSVNAYLNELKPRVEKIHEYEDDFAEANGKNSLGKILTDSKNGFGGYIETLKEYEQVLDHITNGDYENKDSILKALADDFPEFSSRVDTAAADIAKLKQQLSDYKQALDDEYKKIDKEGLGDYADKIKDGTLQSVFGNVDMDKRTIITWSDELKETYKDALASWDYNPEVGSVDTVFGMSERFGEDLNGSGWEVAFTPILPDGTFLSRDTVNEYINSILSEAYANDGKVTEDELKEIDAQGKQISNTFVKGIFAGMDASEDYGEDGNGNKASLFGKLMHFAGNFGAIKINTKGIEDATNAINAAAAAAEKATASLSELSKSLDNIQSAYKSVQSAIQEYNEQGYLSVDTYQALMELEPKYLNMLIDENGNLNLNSDAVQKNTAAYIENMGIKAAQNLIDKVSNLSGEAAQLEYLTGVTEENTAATWENITAQLVSAEAVSSPEVMTALKQRINAIYQMTEATKEENIFLCFCMTNTQTYISTKQQKSSKVLTFIECVI